MKPFDNTMQEMLNGHGKLFTKGNAMTAAKEWINCGFSVFAANEWCKAGFWNPLVVKVLKNKGFTPMVTKAVSDKTEESQLPSLLCNYDMPINDFLTKAENLNVQLNMEFS
jgi:hypothetical protein